MARPEEFTVEKVLKREEWEGNDGPMIAYELLFADDQGTYKGHVPANQDPSPEDGGTVKGWKNPGGKFGFAKEQSSNGSQRASKPGSDEFARRADHPAVEARAKHSTALGAAPAYYELLRTEGVLDKAKDKAAALDVLRGLIAWLEESYPVVLSDEQRPADDQIPF